MKKQPHHDEQKQSNSAPHQSKELLPAWNALYQNEFDVVLSTAKPFLHSENDVLKSEAHQLTGLAHFDSKEYKQALLYFQVVAQSSTDTGDWFNILTSATLAGDFQTAKNAFEKAMECQKLAGNSQQPSIPFTIYYYACALRDKEQWGIALEQINELRKIYEQLCITDDNFVYIRGVPFLSHTLQVAIDVFRGLGKEFNADEWLNSLAKKLDEDGSKLVQDYQLKLKTDA